jgi:superfamily II DNA or RNA helicase
VIWPSSSRQHAYTRSFKSAAALSVKVKATTLAGFAPIFKRAAILLTERREHLEYFRKQLGNIVKNIIVLHGGMGIKQRRAITEQLATISKNETRVLLATGRYIGEGFDDARLDTLFLALPVSWKGTLVQYAGRLHRVYEGKTDVRIFDYIDRNVPMLIKMFQRRLRGYKSMGYEMDKSNPPNKNNKSGTIQASMIPLWDN